MSDQREEAAGYVEVHTHLEGGVALSVMSVSVVGREVEVGAAGGAPVLGLV